MGGVAKDAASEVLGYELIVEGQGHQVDVQGVSHLEDLAELAIFQLVVKQRAHLHEHVVVNVVALLPVQELLQPTNEASLGGLSSRVCSIAAIRLVLGVGWRCRCCRAGKSGSLLRVFD